jgi:hypothetical protein
MREEERKGEEKGRRGEEESKGERAKRRRGETAEGVVAVYKAIFPTELLTESNCCRCN